MAPSPELAARTSVRTWFGQRANLGAVCLGCIGIAAMIALALANRETWNVDFNQYYAVGTLAGTGHVYDWKAIQAIELQHGVKAVPFGRLPFFALAFKPITLLPFPLARALFFAIEIAALVGFVALWPFSRKTWAAAAVCWSAPVAMSLAFGQDPVLFLFFATLGFWLLRAGRDFWAGVAFAVCSSKIHIAMLLPVVLAAQSKWKTLLGGLTGGAAIVGLSFAAEGPAWPARLMELTLLPEFDPAAGRMPNLRGLLSFFGGSFALEMGIAVLIAATVYFLARRVPLQYGMTLALSAGLMVSHHSYVYDCTILLPALLLAFEERLPKWLRMWALLLMTPVPYMIILTNMELPGHLAVTGYTVALILTVGYMRLGGAPSLRIGSQPRHACLTASSAAPRL